MKLKKLLLALIFVVGSLTPLTSSARGHGGGHRGGGHRGGHGRHGSHGRGWGHGGWGWGGGVRVDIGLGYGAWYSRPYGYYTSVNLCWADMQQLRDAYKKALDRIKDLETQVGQINSR